MDLADRPALARRLAALHRDVLTRYCAALPEGEARPLAGGVAAFTAPDWPLNRLGGLPPDAVLDDAALAALGDFCAEHRVSVEVEADPMILAVPGNLERLAAHGLRTTWQRSALARRLGPGAPPPPHRPDAPPVHREPDPEAFAALVARGFADGRAQAPESFAHRVQAIGQRLSGAVGLVATIDGRPAGGGAMRILEGVASLYGQSVLPEARRRGAQTAIIAESLRIAAAAGCDLAAVDADPGSASERTLLRAGFQTLWTVTGFRAA